VEQSESSVLVEVGGRVFPHQQFEPVVPKTALPRVKHWVPQYPLELKVSVELKVKPVEEEKQPSAVCAPADTVRAAKRVRAARRVVVEEEDFMVRE
jgi:hypothetical protein